MPTLPSKATARIASETKRFQPIIDAAKSRDVNESDTVVIVTDMLQYIFGYDKYSEITSEHMIRGTYCDLAVNIDGKLALLIEVKAVGLDLKESYVKQAVDYAANKGCDWVVLTNGIVWRAYKVTFAKPIAQELVVDMNILALNPKKSDDVELLGLLSKEGWQRSHLDDYKDQRQALSRYTLGAVILSEPIVNTIRREVRRLSPDVKISTEDIALVLESEVLKRDVLEGDKADEAKRLLKRSAQKAMRARESSSHAKEEEVDATPIESGE